MYAPSFRFMSNPYSNNDSFNSGNNGAEYPGPGHESASHGNDANGQSGYGQQQFGQQQFGQQQYGQPGYAGSPYPGDDSLFGRDVDAIQVIADSFRYFGRNWAQWIFGPLVQIVIVSILYLLLTLVLAGSGTSIDCLLYTSDAADDLLTV